MPKYASLIFCAALCSPSHGHKIYQCSQSAAHPIDTVYLYSHGFGDIYKTAAKLSDIIKCSPFFGFEYPDAGKKFGSFKLFSSGMAQSCDIQALDEAYKSLATQCPEAKKVIVGISRGAATIAAWYGGCDAEKPAAVVLESPFDTLPTVLDHLIGRFCKKGKWLRALAHKMAQYLLGKYDCKGKSPADLVKEHAPHDTPTLIICSREDKIVPWHSSAALYITMREAGNLNTHLLILDKGPHGSPLFGPQKEQYLQVLHAFYRTYNLPHDELLADQGEDDFLLCQPSCKEVANILPS